MRGGVLLAVLWALFSIAHAAAQTEEAKEDGKAFADTLRPDIEGLANTEPTAEQLPGYTSDTPSEAGLYDVPETWETQGTIARSSNDNAVAVDEILSNNPATPTDEIVETLDNALTLQEDPVPLVSGYSEGGGDCVAIPGGETTTGIAQFTCNVGNEISQTTGSCTIDLQVVTQEAHFYFCSRYSTFCNVHDFSSCQFVTNVTIPCGYIYGCIDLDIYACPSVLPSGPAGHFLAEWPFLQRNEIACSALEAATTCGVASAEVCTQGPETRVIDGVSYTEDCWQWQRDYACTVYTPASDCDALEANGECTFREEYCITEEEPCYTYERVYDCPGSVIESAETNYICDGNIACIEGNCEQFERVANTEFDEAVSGLAAMSEAAKQLDPNNLRIFNGDSNRCKKKLFSLFSCCGGNGIPLIGDCNEVERALPEKIDNGLCHYVGTYCSKKFLGACLTKTKNYCCYGSKLSRIIQVQGRAQLGIGWDRPKDESCNGFTVAQFQILDLSLMDFSEVEADLMASVSLPDQLETVDRLQDRIGDYYAAAEE